MIRRGAGVAADRLEADVLVIGAGIAGLCAALSAFPRRVLVLSPDAPTRASSSARAQGGIAAPLGAEDSVDLHVRDTLAAAAHAADPIVVSSVVGNATAAVAFLERLGVTFDRDGPDRSLHLEAGHSRPRVVHAAGDRSGAAIVAALWARAAEAAHIDVLHGWRAIELIQGGDGIAGVAASGLRDRPQMIAARDTVLATGGLGQLFALTTNGTEATGDGLAMALAAGARTAALEFMQFHPTALKVDADPLPLLTEALRGAGARLVNGDGRRIMSGHHPLGDLAPRDVVARAVYECSERGEQVFLDATSLFLSSRADAFPGARATARCYGFDPATTPLPVTAAAHFHMGGVAVDDRGRTSLPGLWACGEVACTGLHGANRLASNSLLEAVVCGRNAGRALSEIRSAVRPVSGRSLGLDCSENGAAGVTARVRALMWRAMGPVRDAEGLVAALGAMGSELEAIGQDRTMLRKRLGLAIAMMRAAVLRTESRGAHWRRDFPDRDLLRDGPRAVHGDECSGIPRA